MTSVINTWSVGLVVRYSFTAKGNAKDVWVISQIF